MPGDLAFDLHQLVLGLDRSADRILAAEEGITYRRFLALLVLAEVGPTTQRVLADALGVSEPSVSRMAGVLADAGMLDVVPDPGGGNRRRLSLTPSGKEVVERCRSLLEGRLAEVVERSGVPYEGYVAQTRALTAALAEAEREARS